MHLCISLHLRGGKGGKLENSLALFRHSEFFSIFFDMFLCFIELFSSALLRHLASGEEDRDGPRSRDGMTARDVAVAVRQKPTI